MRDILWPPLRAAALAAFITGLVLLLLNPPSFGGLGDLLTLLVGAAIVLVTAWLTTVLIGDARARVPRRRRPREALALLPPPEQPPSEFDELVMQALDELPQEFREVLEHTPVVISNLGREHGAYGHYMGGTVARDTFPDRIVIYQDTLERDFGHDPPCCGRRSSEPCATKWPTTWAGMSPAYAASASEDSMGRRIRFSRRGG